MTFDDGLSKLDVNEQSGKQKTIQNFISLVNQCNFNLDNTNIDDVKNEHSDKMIKFKESIQTFDIYILVKDLTNKVNKLDKTKNILIKEL